MENHFADAEKLQRDNPEAFQRPSAVELDNIKSGDSVQVSCANERFWITVQTVSGNNITGIVNNDLMSSHVHGLNYGDTTAFEKKNVYKVRSNSAWYLVE